MNGPSFENATGKGLYWEIHAQRLLGGRVLSLETMNGPCDLLLPDGRKVDVKSSNLYRRKKKKGHLVNPARQTGWWVFNRNAPKVLDAFFCICLRDNKPEKYFLIPADVFPLKGMVISPKGKKYAKYEWRS